MRRRKMQIARCAALLAVLVTLALALMGAAVPGATVGDAQAGELHIRLKDGDTGLTGGTFALYYVAKMDSTPQLHYSLREAFSAATDVDFDKVHTADDLRKAAGQLMRYTKGMHPFATLTTDAGSADEMGLALGVWLVVETAAPKGYTCSEPFLVFLPMENEEGTGWVYNCTVLPKVSRVQSSQVITVRKVWEDAGHTEYRPASVLATLFRDGVVWDTQRLDAQNGWSYAWKQLPADGVWTVEETSVPEGYACTVSHTGTKFVLTNTYQRTTTGVPKTGDLQWPWYALDASCILVLVVAVIRWRRGKTKGR